MWKFFLKHDQLKPGYNVNYQALKYLKEQKLQEISLNSLFFNMQMMGEIGAKVLKSSSFLEMRFLSSKKA